MDPVVVFQAKHRHDEIFFFRKIVLGNVKGGGSGQARLL